MNATDREIDLLHRVNNSKNNTKNENERDVRVLAVTKINTHHHQEVIRATEMSSTLNQLRFDLGLLQDHRRKDEVVLRRRRKDERPLLLPVASERETIVENRETNANKDLQTLKDLDEEKKVAAAARESESEAETTTTTEQEDSSKALETIEEDALLAIQTGPPETTLLVINRVLAKEVTFATGSRDDGIN